MSTEYKEFTLIQLLTTGRGDFMGGNTSDVGTTGVFERERETETVENTGKDGRNR